MSDIVERLRNEVRLYKQTETSVKIHASAAAH
jgi:hypothetical protein